MSWSSYSSADQDIDRGSRPSPCGVATFASGEAIREAQASPNRGILVTRHDHGSLTVELSAEVPHGTTIERDLRAQQAWSSAAG